MRCSSHIANARLTYWKKRGWVVPTETWIAHDADMGWKRSRLWDVTSLGCDVRPGSAVVWNMGRWKGFFYSYRCLQKRCEDAQWKERHAFTHMVIDPVEMREAA